MKLAVACDHRGYEGKRRLIPLLKKLGHDCRDFGCDSTAAADYPDHAAPAARAVAKSECDLGILLDGSGIGMSIVANKIHGIRAALAHDEVTLHDGAEREGVLANDVEAFLPVKRNGLWVLLPNPQPDAVAAAGNRLVHGSLHQGVPHARALP